MQTAAENNRRRLWERYGLEWLRCANDPAYFIRKYVKIVEVEDELAEETILPFDLWPSQEELLIELQKPETLWVLKARRLGVTTLVVAWFLHGCMTIDGLTCFVISIDEEIAREQVRRFKNMYRVLPEWLKVPIKRETLNMIEFTNGARFRALSARAASSRGYTANRVLGDEVDYMPDPKGVYSSARHAASKGTLVMVTTANYGQALFRNCYKMVEAGKMRGRTAFFGAYSRPGRDERWWQRGYEEAVDKTDYLQDFPRTVEEAFQAAGGALIPKEVLELPTARKEIYLPVFFIPKEVHHWAEVPGWREQYEDLYDKVGQDLRIWRFPAQFEDCVVWGDMALGYEDSDASAIVVQAEGGEFLATMAVQQPPEDMAELALPIVEAFPGVAGAERNSYGAAFLRKLADLGVTAIYHEEDRPEKPGIYFSSKMKRDVVQPFIVGLKSGEIVMHDPDMLSEFRTLEKKKNARDQYGAAHGCHDDIAIAALQCNYVREKVYKEGKLPPALLQRWTQQANQREGLVASGGGYNYG